MISTKARYIAVPEDIYDHRMFFLHTERPCKELMNILDAKHANKVYVDTTEGPAHIGYIINKVWWILYAVEGRGPRKE